MRWLLYCVHAYVCLLNDASGCECGSEHWCGKIDVYFLVHQNVHVHVHAYMCVPLKSLGAASLACLPVLGVVLVCSNHTCILMVELPWLSLS